MHSYYQKNRLKFKKNLINLIKPVSLEIEKITGSRFSVIIEEIWNFYEKNMLENFLYIGGDSVSGTSNMCGACCFIAMGEVLKKYNTPVEESGHLMTLAYERKYKKIPSFLKSLLKKVFTSPKLLKKMYMKKDRKNEENCRLNPGSYLTETQDPPEKGFDFSYHNLVCPISDFAVKHGYEEYMPYICNLDYVMFGVLGAPLYREHTCFEDGDYCDFKLKNGAPVMDYWPPVFTQGKGYK
ncbi:MAG: L-2-amino-thiazoline-4-carboxylic acid hydrolase [Sphaerochaetaceae bacterium]|nr:L-2-amino-thiazoline-4-carboxylic acid hydrolase [Sphaerochaetaceae bacterium]